MTAFPRRLAKTSLDQQIEEVQRELDQRESVYARAVAAKKMRESVANFHMDRMRCVLDTLKWLRLHEAAVRDYVEAKKAEAPAQ